MVPSLFDRPVQGEIIKGKIARARMGLGFRYLCRYHPDIDRIGFNPFLWTKSIYPTVREAVRAHYRSCTCGSRKVESHRNWLMVSNQKDQKDQKGEGMNPDRFLSLPFLAATNFHDSFNPEMGLAYLEQLEKRAFKTPPRGKAETIRTVETQLRGQWGLDLQTASLRRVAKQDRIGKFIRWPSRKQATLMLPPTLVKPARDLMKQIRNSVCSDMGSGSWIQSYLQYLEYELASGILTSPAQMMLDLIPLGLVPLGLAERNLLIADMESFE